MTGQYWDRVVAECVGEIREGRTPNPDILCNSHVKFGAFYSHLESHYGTEFDRVASGHYARWEPLPLRWAPPINGLFLLPVSVSVAE